jgi:hypothetical protein
MFLYVFTFPVVCVTNICPSLMSEVTNLFTYPIDSLIPMKSRFDRKVHVMKTNPNICVIYDTMWYDMCQQYYDVLYKSHVPFCVQLMFFNYKSFYLPLHHECPMKKSDKIRHIYFDLTRYGNFRGILLCAYQHQEKQIMANNISFCMQIVVFVNKWLIIIMYIHGKCISSGTLYTSAR